MKNNLRIFVVALVLVMLVAACAPTAAADPVLTVNGKAYTRAEMEALGTTNADYTNKDGETTTYEGVLLSAILADAGAADAGGEVTFVAADGYEAGLSADEALACADCIVAFDGESLRSVMPEMSSKLQVKDLVEIKLD
jgi:hypothetical protein